MENEKTDLENFRDVLDTLRDSVLNNYLIEDNKYLFIYNDETYRIVMPSQKQKADAAIIKNKLYIQLVNENLTCPEEQKNKTRNQLKIDLQKAGIVNIEELEYQRTQKYNELQGLYYDLAQILSPDKKSIEEYVSKINKVKYEFQTISSKIEENLIASIDSRIEKVYVEYITFVCTEKCIKSVEGEKWVKVWTSLTAYQNENTGLEDKAAEGVIRLLMTIN